MERIKDFLKINFPTVLSLKEQRAIVTRVAPFCQIGVKELEDKTYELFIFNFRFKNILLKDAPIIRDKKEDVIIDKIKTMLKQPHIFKKEILKHEKSFTIFKNL